ncbi:GPI-anchored domain-containing protein [Fusarium acuminatum]|uniref:GPI-anchored domain-containing protein n=1 Tax=Fusarium acuminatum TaxID=5515 RepID=A0ABZ2X6H2_9HYPO
MHLPLATATLVALAARVLGQTADFDPIYQPPAWATLISGSRFQIVWDAPAKYAGQTVTISLIGGDTQDTQTPIRDIATGVPNDDGAYDWVIDHIKWEMNVYGLVIKLESDPQVFQYSNPFKIAHGIWKVSPVSNQPTPIAHRTWKVNPVSNQLTSIAIEDHTPTPITPGLWSKPTGTPY